MQRTTDNGVPKSYGSIKNATLYPRLIIKEDVEVLEEPDYQKIYCVTVSSIGDREAEPMKPQKYGCPAKPCTKTTLTDIHCGWGNPPRPHL